MGANSSRATRTGPYPMPIKSPYWDRPHEEQVTLHVDYIDETGITRITPTPAALQQHTLKLVRKHRYNRGDTRFQFRTRITTHEKRNYMTLDAVWKPGDPPTIFEYEVDDCGEHSSCWLGFVNEPPIKDVYAGWDYESVGASLTTGTVHYGNPWKFEQLVDNASDRYFKVSETGVRFYDMANWDRSYIDTCRPVFLTLQMEGDVKLRKIHGQPYLWVELL